MSDAMDAYWQLQPLARTLATAIFVTSIGGHLGLIPTGWLFFHSSLAIFHMPPQIWRFLTTFLLSGPQLGIILDPYFVYQYLSQIESGNPKFQRKEDVLWYLITVSGFILVGPSLCAFCSLHTAHNAKHPRIICPHSAISPNYSGSWNRGRSPSYLGRPSFALRVGSRCGHGGMPWMTRAYSICSVWFLRRPTFFHLVKFDFCCPTS